MTQLAFYPGCALQSMSWDYRESIKQVVSNLDIELTEIREWTCCGATAAHSLDDRMAVILPARNLAGAEALGLDLAVACPMCYKRLSYSRQMLLNERAHSPWKMTHKTAIIDLSRFLATDLMLERIRDRVRVNLSGLRVVCYYGCQVVRPPKITGYSDYENPQHLDRLASSVGATVIDWSLKGTCCGASIGIPKKEIGLALVGKLLKWAVACEAQAIIVCCPLCQANLDLYQPQLIKNHSLNLPPNGLPILYYTEMLGMAFAIDLMETCLKSHLVNPLPLLELVMGR